MSKHRRAAKVDINQQELVKQLRMIHGVSIALNHDDILLGFKGKTFWFEIKSGYAVSRVTGKVLESKIQGTQKKLRSEWTGHYSIVSCLDDILYELGVLT